MAKKIVTQVFPETFPLWWQVKFWEEHFKWNLETGCLEYTGRVISDRYPRVAHEGISYSTHRVAYFLYYEQDPGDLLVRHLCHNRRCANPRHLVLGTHLDNSRDMVEAGRSQTGEKHWTRRMPERAEELKARMSALAKERSATFNGENHPTTKLTAEIVREIKILANEGMGNKELAEKFNVTHSNISAIVLGKSWKHIEVPTREKDRTWIDGKLTPEQKDEIRQLDTSGVSKSELARRYKVGWTTVNRICNG